MAIQLPIHRPIALLVGSIVICIGVVLAGIYPYFVEQRDGTRRLSDRERNRMANTLSSGPKIHFRVVERPSSEDSPRARAMGLIPSLRYVFISERLLEALSPAEGEAVIAHEIGHHHYYHLTSRILSIAVVLGILMVVSIVITWNMLLSAVILGLFLLFLFVIDYRMEYVTDEYAAGQVNHESMIEALRHLKEITYSTEVKFMGIVPIRPSFDDRIDRLKTEAPSESDDEPTNRS